MLELIKHETQANNTESVGDKTHTPNKMSLSTSRAIASKAIWPFFVKVGKEESTLGNLTIGRVNRTGSGLNKAVKTNRMLPMTGLENEILHWEDTCVSLLLNK